MKHRKLDTTPEVSQRMAKVSLKGGKSEVALAKALWNQGVRYRKNYKAVPGSPDIAITKTKVAVFIDGEFTTGRGMLEPPGSPQIREPRRVPAHYRRFDYLKSIKEICVRSITAVIQYSS
jgi:DNA mismatch endonuclease Vsr